MHIVEHLIDLLGCNARKLLLFVGIDCRMVEVICGRNATLCLMINAIITCVRAIDFPDDFS